MEKIVDFERLDQLKPKYAGKKIVHCHGVFDLLHYGHYLHLQSAKKLGDILVVTLTPDRFVNKGPSRPYYKQDQRCFMLSSLCFVDFVSINSSPLATTAIQQLKPDLYIKGPDYKNLSGDLTGGILVEKNEVERWGGQLVFTEDEQLSSSKILNEHFQARDPKQKAFLGALRKQYTDEDILKILNSIDFLALAKNARPTDSLYFFPEKRADAHYDYFFGLFQKQLPNEDSALRHLLADCYASTVLGQDQSERPLSAIDLFRTFSTLMK